jgi:hypothetical protein
MAPKTKRYFSDDDETYEVKFNPMNHFVASFFIPLCIYYNFFAVIVLSSCLVHSHFTFLPLSYFSPALPIP